LQNVGWLNINFFEGRSLKVMLCLPFGITDYPGQFQR
jgi:hypothetical protein